MTALATSGKAPQAVVRASAYGWYVAMLLSLAHLVSFTDRYVLALVLEPLKQDLGLSDAKLGLLHGTGFVVLYTVAAMPLGWLADRAHRRNLIIAGIVAWSLATAMSGFASSFGELLAARVLVGLGEAALVPAAMSLLASFFPKAQMGRAVSLFTTGASLGKSGAFIGGGAILAMLTAMGGLNLGTHGTLAPWQGTFVAMAIPGLVLSLLLLTIAEPARRESAAARLPMSAAFAYIAQHRAAFGLHIAASVLTVLANQALGAWAPSFFVRSFGLTAPAAGYAIGSIVLIAAPLGHLSGGTLTDLFTRRGARSPAAPVATLGLALSLPSLILMTKGGTLAGSLLGFGLFSFFITLATPASLAGIQLLTPDALRGTVTSFFLALTTLIGIGLGPLMVGMVTDLAGGPSYLGQSLNIVLGVAAVLGIAAALASRDSFARTVRALAEPD